MTASQINAELYRQLSIIAEDETLMKKLVKYAKKLVAKKEQNSTLMTEDEFFRRVDEAKKGSAKSFDSIEDLDQYIRSL